MDLPILMYHDVYAAGEPVSTYGISVASFRQQMRTLRWLGFESISFRRLFRHWDGEADLPRKPVLITFDDGYASFREKAVPVMTEHGFTATVFLVANAIGAENSWDDGSGEPRLPLMDRNQIAEAIEAGAEIGSHSLNHVDHASVEDATLLNEVTESRRMLEDEFGSEVQVYAYPYGRHDERCFDALRDAGYRGAVSIFSVAPDVTSNPFGMRRVYPHDRDGTFRFALKVSRPYLRWVAWRDRARDCTL